MHDIIVWRTVWKEYRQQRGFWLAIFAGGVLFQTLVVVVTMLSFDPPTPYAFFAIALSMPVLYALGSGAQLFAGEYDAETYEFQRALPVRWQQLAFGKLAYSLASAAALMVVLWATALVFARGWLPPAMEHGLLWYGGAVALWEALAWSVLLSLILRSVLVVVLLTPLAMLASFMAVQFALEPWYRSEDAFVLSLPLRFLPALAVLAVDLWLARRWLNERPLPAWSGWRRGGRVAGDARSTAFARLPPRTSSLGLLVWHEWRQSRATIAAIWATILAFLAFVFLARGMVWGPLYERLVHEILELLTDGILPLVAAVSGACVFLGDQRRCRFRFFAEHGISPRRVWLSRQLVWLTTPCIWAFLVTAAVLAVHAWGWPATEYRGMRGENLDLLRSLGLALSLYCVAQAAPLFVRSVAIGFFGSLLGCLGFGIWVGMMSSCRVPIWFSIAPIPLCLLLATWLRAPDWIVEQATWRSRLRAAMSIGGPLAAVGIAVICYRVFEVPQVKLSFDPAAYRRPPSAAAVRTSELYCEAYTLMAPVPQVESVDAWVAETANDEQRQARRRIADEIPQRREQAVARILQASQRGECWFPPRWDSSRAWQTATTSSQLGGNMSFSLSQLRMAGEEADQLAWHVLETARPLEETGMLDEAQELYGAAMRCAHQLQRQTDLAYQDAGDRIEAETCARLARWAARPGQTAERLRSVRQRLQREFFTDLPQRRGVLIGAYLEARDGFGLDSMAADAPRLSEVVWHRRARWIIPWEYVRLGRLLDLYVETGLTRLQAVETSLVQYGSAGEVARQACPESLATLLDTTPLAQPRLSGSLLEAHRRDRRPVWDALLAQAVRHRVLQLQLALLAWRLKHGELPESLEQLIGSEIDQLPVNSFSGSVFLYRPRGVETPLVAAATTSLSTRPSPEKATRIEPHTPILWCNGPYLRARMPARSTDAIEPSERVYQPWDSPPGPSRQPQNEAETWGLGWAFPIPVPAVPDSTPKTPDAALNE